MKIKANLVADQQGSVLVIALLILMAITILGVVSINTGMVELQIAGNERQIRETFYLAEAAAAEGVQRLLGTAAIDLNSKRLFWHHSSADIAYQSIDLRKPEDWDVDLIAPDNGIASALDNEAFIAAVEWRVSTGASLIATGTRLYVNRVYGLCRKDNSDILIEIGYKHRY